MHRPASRHQIPFVGICCALMSFLVVQDYVYNRLAFVHGVVALEGICWTPTLVMGLYYNT